MCQAPSLFPHLFVDENWVTTRSTTMTSWNVWRNANRYPTSLGLEWNALPRHPPPRVLSWLTSRLENVHRTLGISMEALSRASLDVHDLRARASLDE